MDDRDKARPVSGEIMTGDTSRSSATVRADFSDAEIVAVESAPQVTPQPRPKPAPAEGMDFLRALDTSKPSRRQSAHGGPLFWTCGLALVGLAFWISGGHALVRQSLPLAGMEKGEALQIGDVRSRVENRGGHDILFVEGEAYNRGDRHETMRPIEISIIDNEGSATRYFLGTRADELAPGSRYSFSSRIEAPRNGVRSVSVSFQEGVR